MGLQAKLTSLATALRDQRDKILADWLASLRIGMEKPGIALTDLELRDHFGELLEDLSNQLEVPLTETSEISALKHAETHGDMRWVQGYKLTELIREVASLRTVMIAAVVAHGNERLSLHEQSLANIIVHRFFDALVLESASFFATLAQDAAVLRERQHLAQELHDGACQTIQAAVFQLALVRSEVDARAAEQISNITASLTEGIKDIRTIVHGLVAVVRKFEHGLPAALEQLGADISQIVPCGVRCDSGLEIPTRQGFQLFRIAQEAVGNACKYANAKNLCISLVDLGETFEFQIYDDGQGFDVSETHGAGIGLFNMQQRARAIGANLAIETSPGMGTTITCILPKSAIKAPESESSTFGVAGENLVETVSQGAKRGQL